MVFPDDKRTVSTSFEKTIKLRSTGIREYQKTLDAKSDWVFLMAFSPDGKQIASSSNNTIELWDAATGKHQKTLVGLSGLVCAVAFSADGKQVVSSSEDRTIMLWDSRASFKASKYLVRAIDCLVKLRPWREIKTVEVITTVKISPDNRFIITNIGPMDLAQGSPGRLKTHWLRIITEHHICQRSVDMVWRLAHPSTTD